MPKISDNKMFPHAENGSIAIMAAFSLMMVIFITGMVYDFGSLFVTRTELQQVADAAAIAGGRALGALYAGGEVDDGNQIVTLSRKIFSDQQTFVPGDADKDLIKSVVNDAASENTAGGLVINIATADIAIGFWNTTTNTFFENTQPANAVQVTARHTNAAFFGQLVNVTGYSLTATATAALTPLQYVPPAGPSAELPSGEVIFPLGIDQFELAGGAFCGNFISVPNDLGAQPWTGWTTFNNDATQGNFNTIVTDLVTNGDPPATPQALAMDGELDGTSFKFGGQGNAQIPGLHDIAAAYDPSPIDPMTGAPDLTDFIYWESLLPVYQNNSGAGLPLTGQEVPIVGFVSGWIVASPVADAVSIVFQCGVVGTGRSGDLNDPNLAYGTFGSVPVLVQ